MFSKQKKLQWQLDKAQKVQVPFASSNQVLH